MAAKAATQPSTVLGEKYTTGSVISKDGTIIGYRQLGQGPGLVLLHGGMESSQSHQQLAEALAPTHTVYTPDRRGRGLSGPYHHGDSIEQEVEDMAALLSKTGAQNVFGISAGAMIWLQAVLSLPAIKKAALYDPPLSINGSLSTAFMARYDREIAQGRVMAALVTAMQGAQMGPPIFNAMPRWLLERLTALMVNREDKNARSGDVTMRLLAPTLHYDFRLAAAMIGPLDRFKQVRAEILLLGGSTSPAYMKTALDALEKALPHVRRIEFAGLGHGGSGNSDRGGQPEQVAAALRQFFA